MDQLGYSHKVKHNNFIGLSIAIFYKREKLDLIDTGFEVYEDVSDRVESKSEYDYIPSEEAQQRMSNLIRQNNSREQFLYCRFKEKQEESHHCKDVFRPEFVFVETQLNQLCKPSAHGDNKFKVIQLQKYFSQNFANQTDAPIFIAGDFNEEPNSISIRNFMEKSFVDCYTLKALQEVEDNKPEDAASIMQRSKPNR